MRLYGNPPGGKENDMDTDLESLLATRDASRLGGEDERIYLRAALHGTETLNASESMRLHKALRTCPLR